ncbi:stalk domain-containing protein [Clostridium beijerinckii]|uniref:Putative endo-beta-N-acetylglucosaminidase n=1 Tax=Clostridium beijerinckii TaxID=1520 RepID=A0A1S8S1I4_CLOBE|nr:stalk domain-containing protein [Clostridium beijerinckii]NRY60668.1 hypothetical protein [Clostridium beijerinckii]OOM59287.1 putative endo-beta-N-acetylglucosaminidase precursor [Clostridium beijerinckii]
MKSYKKEVLKLTFSSMLVAVVLAFNIIITTKTAFADAIYKDNYYDYIYINGKVLDERPFEEGGIMFVPGKALAEAFGDKVEGDANGNGLKITHGGDVYKFGGDSWVHYKNGQMVYNSYAWFSSSTHQRVEIAASTDGLRYDKNIEATNKTVNKVLYIPLRFFLDELGYTVKSDGVKLIVGSAPTADQYKEEANRTNKPNGERSIDEGWVCPQLRSTSVDDPAQDAQTLINELEFQLNGPGSITSVCYDIAGFKGSSTSTQLTWTGVDTFANCFTVNFAGYESGTKDPYYSKINEINPQVLKFYFPNSWQWLDNIIKTTPEKTLLRYTIDGRDTYIRQGDVVTTIYFSKVGGTIDWKDADWYKISSSGTIGQQYTLNKGYWVKDNGKWYHKSASGVTQKGWLVDNDDKWYYLDKDTGVMQTGWIHDSDIDAWYYCYSNGERATNTTIDGCKIDSSGIYMS